jgi:aspartyl-tRNA synthetase
MHRTYAKDTIDCVGKEVLLKGWVNVRRDHGKLIFLDIRDVTGIVQVVVNPRVSAEAHKIAQELRSEYVVELQGVVNKRPKELVNPNLETGKIEIEAKKIALINRSEIPPFPLDNDGYAIDEDLRLKYRYLDLRRERLRKNLKLRHQIVNYMCNFLDARGFIQIETPILTKATPEGARDFLVPSRLQPGKFYALPQSPQQYKQLLMVAGFEKYYQIARCFRDEDARRDRSYGEFTQLDIEMSFTTQEEILNLTEELYIEITEKIARKKILKKPFPRFTHAEALKKFKSDKFDLRPDPKDPNLLAFAWVLDFPLFEQTETRELASSHHPFTAPKDEDIPLLDTDPLKAHSWQHDLVCNGLEIGGGSIRITNPEIQRKIFKILGHKPEEIEEKFGHLLKAFEYGVPPHGGIAPGIERLLMVLANEEDVREVTAFPTSASGITAVMDAPSEADPKLLKELHIKIDIPKK